MQKQIIESNFQSTSWSNSYSKLVRTIAASYTRENIVIHGLMGFLVVSAWFLYALNAWVFHYTPMPLRAINIVSLPIILTFCCAINYAQKLQSTRLGLFCGALGNLFLFVFVSFVIFGAIISTPFTIIDFHMVQWDLWLGFDVTKLMAWTHQYPLFVKTLKYCYFSWVKQILLAPLILALLNRPKEIRQYFMGAAICFPFWVFIYYFFPTVAPAGVLHSPYFTLDQYDLVKRFYEVHQFLPISTFRGGMVSMPSGHVMYALLVLIAFRNIKFIFYPLLVVNSLLIFATMALGYHYLVDIIASFIIVGIALLAIKYIDKKDRVSAA